MTVDETTNPSAVSADDNPAPEQGSVDSAAQATDVATEPAGTARLSYEIEVVEAGEDVEEGYGYSSEEMEKMASFYGDTLKSIQEGEIIQGRVSAIHPTEVIMDVGFKSEGAIPLSEFTDPGEVKVGDEFEVYLEKIENQDGLVVLSKERADFLKVWNKLKLSYENRDIVEGTVDRRIKGGLVVKLMGVDAFLPGSQIALRQVPNLDDLIDETMEFRIIKVNKRRRNIVVSRRVVLEEDRQKKKEKLMAELEKDQVREGVVKNITDFGAFVDLGGIDGLLHLTDITWGRVSHPSDVVNIGDTLKVKILDFDKERERISLGLKQLSAYPWEKVEEKYPVSDRVKGKVVSITDYGAFVELEEGVEGLIHISEMSWTRHVRHPSKIVSIGDEVEAVILNVDKENEKISLGLKQTEPDPWDTLETKYPVDTPLRGKVRNLTNFGAFVEIEDGIDGLVHISDMSWTKRVRHPAEVVKKGDEVDVIVLEIDKDKRRISLGMKQVQEDPWDQLAEEYAVGSELEGKITRVLDRGCVVELREGVEGFVPVSHLGKRDIKKPQDHFAEGDELPLQVIKMDPKNRRIVLSVTSYLEDKDEETVEAYYTRFDQIKEGAETASTSDTSDADDYIDEAEFAEAPAEEAESVDEAPAEQVDAEATSEDDQEEEAVAAVEATAEDEAAAGTDEESKEV